MLGGKKGYTFISQNLHLPSLTSVKRYINETNDRIQERKLCTKHLLEKFSEDTPKLMIITEDATKIVPRIVYDAKNYSFMGLTDNDTPLRDFHKQNNTPQFKNIKIAHKSLTEQVLAQYVYVLMAQPLLHGVKATPLLMYAQPKFYWRDVLEQKLALKEYLYTLGIICVAFASDGDSRCLKAMIEVIGLRSGHEYFYSDKLWATFFSAPLYFEENKFMVGFQDVDHIINKARLRIYRDNPLFMGKHRITKDFLSDVFKQLPKGQHKLNLSDILNKDSMSSRTAHKLFSSDVRSALQTLHQVEATGIVFYMELFQNQFEAFRNHNLSALERVKMMAFVLFSLRMWRSYLIINEKQTRKQKRAQSQPARKSKII